MQLQSLLSICASWILPLPETRPRLDLPAQKSWQEHDLGWCVRACMDYKEEELQALYTWVSLFTLVFFCLLMALA